MKSIKIAIVLMALNSCNSGASKEAKESTDSTRVDQLEVIKQAFFDVDSLLKIDNGKFWNSQLYGSILIVNTETRVLYANENNASKTFKEVGPIFTDTLPNKINIANTAFNWENKRWSMAMLPLPEDKTSRNNLIIHELFHRIQPKIGFDNLLEQSNSHLDTYQGRLLLKLELEALKKALTSNSDKHINNALNFRKKRQINDETKNAENALEINEGLAEYTAIMLSGRNEKEMIQHLTNSINRFYTNPTFVRSFAYQTIPLYGYLLSKQKSNWHQEITRDSNLTNYFIRSFNVDFTNNQSVEQIAQENDYNYQNIVVQEKDRENIRLLRIEELKIKFLKEPTLKLYFEKPYTFYDPRTLIPLENFGTIYPILRITDTWGILTVENNAFIDSNFGYVAISKPTNVDSEIVKGNGWTLELNKNWKVENVEGKFELKKENTQ